MSCTKTILCLANSRKPPSGRCIAGREIIDDGFGDWIRPVSARPSREISEEERRYEDGTGPRVLDVITIEMSGHVPEHHQHENHVIDDSRYWVKRGTVDWDNLLEAVEDIDGPLWLNGSSSSHGQNDRVHEQHLGKFNRSLYLVRPDALKIVVGLEDSPFGPARRRVRARLELAGHTYAVAVTDPLIERDYLAQTNGDYELNDALICMSLGEVFHSYAYKLAAAVITKQRASGEP